MRAVTFVGAVVTLVLGMVVVSSPSASAATTSDILGSVAWPFKSGQSRFTSQVSDALRSFGSGLGKAPVHKSAKRGPSCSSAGRRLPRIAAQSKRDWLDGQGP